MSQINFEDLANEHPEHKRALRKLEEWRRRHSDVHIIDPKTLAREVQGVDATALALALTLLVKAGLLRRVYKVTTPSGVLADGEFDDPTQIPPRLPDRFEHYFDTAESDVVPVFRMVA
jgi:hypothetical protein